MGRPTLFLLKEDFRDGDGLPYYCPECATISGVLSYFPKIRHSIDVRYVDFERPRQAIVELVGAQNQGCPILVLDKAPHMDAIRFLTGQYDGRYFVSGAKAIALFWSCLYGTSRPH